MENAEPNTKQFFTVIIADDEPAIRNGIKNAIDWESLGLRIAAIVQNGNRAYEEICLHKPDIVITDIMMPGKTGLELIREARSGGISSHFIILSGYDDFRYAKEAIALEVDNFLLKPLSRTELIATLQKTIDRIRSTQVREQEYLSLTESARENILKKLAAGETIEKTELKPFLCHEFSAITAMIIKKQDEAADINKLISSAMPDIEYENFSWSKRIQVLLLYYDADYSKHAAKLLESEAKVCGIQLTIAIGPSVTDIIRFNESFQTGMTALSYQIYDKERIIFDSASIIDTTPPTFNPSDVDLVSLTHMMFAKDADGIREWIKNYFSRLMYVKTPPPSYIKGMCIYLLTDLTRTISHEKHISSSFMPRIDYMQINELLTLNDIEKWTSDLILYMANTSIPESEIANDPVIYKARKLIKDSLGFQMSAQNVAKELNMNFTYFSSYYKQKTGENFSAYINRMRNEYAMQLLDDPMLSIEEISQSLGYTDYRSFYRNFKKTNGISPSRYRTHK